MTAQSAVDWPQALFACLCDAGVRQVSHVPDAGHARLIRLCEGEPSMRVVGLTTEEEGIGVAVGAWLGGQRAVVLMQSSGLGNCVNAIASLADAGRVPLLMAVTMRGEWGEFNPWQVPLARATRDILAALDCRVIEARSPDEVEPAAQAALGLAFGSFERVALLLTQRLIGAKSFTR